jgi:hypothetical protein
MSTIRRTEAELDAADAIDAELRRLGALPHGETSLEAVAFDWLPRGWVCVGDGQDSACGPATAILAEPRRARRSDATDPDGLPDGWLSAWAAISRAKQELPD